MKHALRKYLSRRGSALFMVLSLMTALMILVMAMYFSVVSSRDVQYKVFYQEQAYRSADALSNAIILGLEEDGWKTANNSNSLLSAITNLSEPGKSITTDGNGFSALNISGTKEEQDQIGAYSVTITRMDDETIDGETAQVYDIAITVSNGGVLETTHTYVRMVPPDGQMEQGKANIFTSTGYVPTDVFLDNVETRTDLFYDNEFVVVTGESHILGNINCGGSLKLNHLSQSPGQVGNVATWAIRNTFTNNNTVYMGPDASNRGEILVGGDAIFAGGNINNADIYVGRNAVFASSTNFNNCRLFVQGKLVFDSSSTLPGVIYASGVTNNTGYDIGTISTAGVWDENTRKTGKDPETNPTGIPTDVMTDKEMRDKLEKLTATREYPKWEIDYKKDGKAEDDLYYIPELDPENTKPADAVSNDGYYNNKTITFDGSHYTYYLDWESGNTIPNYFGQGQPLNYTACVIDDVVLGNTDGWPGNKSAAIVIDTGDDPKNQYIIKLNANRDFIADKDNKLDSFSWMPAKGGLTSMTVIVRGCGSVVFDIPEGVTYQATSYTTVIHETWYAILGGKISQLGVAGNRDTLSYTQNAGSAVSFKVADTMKFIHTGCNEDCDECTLVVNKNADTCSKCNEAITQITCDVHKVEYNYCPKCNPGYEPNKDIKGNYYGLCANYLERSAVESAVANLDSNWKSLLKESVTYTKDDGTIVSVNKDKVGKSAMFSGDIAQWYYPTTNVFLVSIDESADIRLANAPDGTTLSNAHYWGFVYAPYMTYRGKGNSAGWAVFCGGMIVSDYIIQNFDVYLSCYPDQLPDQMMNWEDQQEMLEGQDDKKWKISLAGF